MSFLSLEYLKFWDGGGGRLPISIGGMISHVEQSRPLAGLRVPMTRRQAGDGTIGVWGTRRRAGSADFERVGFRRVDRGLPTSRSELELAI